MGYHLIGWSASLANATETDLTPVPDIIQTIQNGHFLPQRDWFVHALMGMSATLPKLRVVTPSLRQVTTPFVSPLETNAVPGARYGIADYRAFPMRMKALEEVVLDATQTSGGAARFNALAAFSFGGLTPAPLGQMYTLRGASTTAAVANTWSQITMTWNDTLPQGIFAVVGMTAFGTGDYAARLVFEDQVERPGSPALATEDLIMSPIFRNGGMGEWGRFNSNRMPNVEVLCNAATAVHTVYMDIVRVQ